MSIQDMCKEEGYELIVIDENYWVLKLEVIMYSFISIPEYNSVTVQPHTKYITPNELNLINIIVEEMKKLNA